MPSVSLWVRVCNMLYRCWFYAMLNETCILFNCMRYSVSLAISRYHHLMDAFSNHIIYLYVCMYVCMYVYVVSVFDLYIYIYKCVTSYMQHFLSPNRDFDFIWSAMYGNCFTFNFDQGSARRSHMPGPQYGELNHPMAIIRRNNHKWGWFCELVCAPWFIYEGHIRSVEVLRLSLPCCMSYYVVCNRILSRNL